MGLAWRLWKRPTYFSWSGLCRAAKICAMTKCPWPRNLPGSRAQGCGTQVGSISFVNQRHCSDSWKLWAQVTLTLDREGDFRFPPLLLLLPLSLAPWSLFAMESWELGLTESGALLWHSKSFSSYPLSYHVLHCSFLETLPASHTLPRAACLQAFAKAVHTLPLLHLCLPHPP